MAQLTKKELQLLAKLRKAKLYPDLQEQLIRDIEKHGVEGVNMEKNRHKILREIAQEREAENANQNVYDSRSGRPMPAQMRRRAEETRAAGFDPISIFAGPIASKLVDKADQTINFAAQAIKGKINQKDREKELTKEYEKEFGPKEAKKMAKEQALKEFRSGRPAEYNQIPSETPEDFKYRMEQREMIQPYLKKLLEDYANYKPDTLTNRFDILGQHLVNKATPGLNAIGQGLYSGASQLGQGASRLGQTVYNDASRFGNQLNQGISYGANSLANRLSSLGNYLYPRQQAQGRTAFNPRYNLDLINPELVDLLNSENNFNVR